MATVIAEAGGEVAVACPAREVAGGVAQLRHAATPGTR